jgi:hypothetical protein
MQEGFHDNERYMHPSQRMQNICTEAVRKAVNATLGEDDRQKPVGRSGLYGFLLRKMAEAALQYAIAKNIDPVDFEIDLGRALAIVGDLRSALVQDWNDKTLDFWDYDRPLDKIKADKAPYIERSSLESVVGDYLALPYRSQAMDRLLVKVLVAMEFYAYGDEMMNPKYSLFGFHPSPLMQSHVLLAYLRGQLINAIFFGGIAALALWAASQGWIGETAVGWTAGICVVLFLLLGAISTFALPFSWYAQIKARRNVTNLLLAMNTIYSELRSDGPISAQYIRDRSNSAAHDGVVWPAPLFAMLDDSIARTGRF